MSGALNALLGTAGAPSGLVDISAGFDVEDIVSSPSEAFALIEFESDGDVEATQSVGTTDVGDWITPKAVAPGAYEIMAEQNSGDAVSGTLDTWLALSTNRSWSLTQSGAGSKAANLTVSIRLGGVTLSSGTVTLAVQVI